MSKSFIVIVSMLVLAGILYVGVAIRPLVTLIEKETKKNIDRIECDILTIQGVPCKKNRTR